MYVYYTYYTYCVKAKLTFVSFFPFFFCAPFPKGRCLAKYYTVADIQTYSILVQNVLTLLKIEMVQQVPGTEWTLVLIRWHMAIWTKQCTAVARLKMLLQFSI